jgi:hypothetical protein
MRGTYDNHLIRTPIGWKIASLTQRISWLEGNPTATQQGAPA